MATPRATSGGFRLGGAAASAPAADEVIDVDVLWEDADEGAGWAERSTRTAAPARPFTLVSPLDAISAYLSAATTRSLPQRVIDLYT